MKKDLIIVIPGIMCDTKNSAIGALRGLGTEGLEVKIVDLHIILKKDVAFSYAVKLFENIIVKYFNKYNRVYIFTHSAGSEVFLRSKYNKVAETLIMWSPSFFFKQNFSDKLKAHSKNKKLLEFDKLLISKKLAKSLDKLETEKISKKIEKIPTTIFYTKEDKNIEKWNCKKIFIPYKHNYTEKQYINIFKKSLKLIGAKSTVS